MAVPKGTKWPIDEHTEAKHAILRAYLQAWFPILSSAHGRIIFVDGFCGPGRYSGGELGSPLIALDVAIDHRKKLRGHLVFLFTDERDDRIEHLKSELSTLQIPKHYSVSAEVGRFEEVFTPVLERLEADHHTLAPAFVFIDPFGFSGIPFSLVDRILRNLHSEVFITFMVNAVQRFVEHPVEAIRSEIVELFGTEEVVDVVRSRGDRTEALRQLYQAQLQTVARFVRSFEIRDKPGRVLYYLFFASNNRLGHLKMKETMWRVDPEGNFRFVDNTDKDQLVLLELDPADDLVRILSSQFAGQMVTGQDVKRYVQDETGFIDRHTTAALRSLEESGGIDVAERKLSGERRRKRSFPDDAVITFS